MRIHRFITPFNPGSSTVIVTDESLLHQWRNVFRLDIGDEVQLCDGQGHEVLGQLEGLDKRSASVHVLRPVEPMPEPNRRITLACAMLKRENFELVIQKAVELGIAVIQPIKTDRTVKLGLNEERMNAIIKEATEQCGRSWLPILKPIIELSELLASSDRIVCFDMDGDVVEPGSLDEIDAILIGPEGGWSDEEREAIEQTKCPILTLGQTTFRAETAAIVASYRAVNGI